MASGGRGQKWGTPVQLLATDQLDARTDHGLRSCPGGPPTSPFDDTVHMDAVGVHVGNPQEMDRFR